MKNQTAGCASTLIASIDWEKVDLQVIILAANQGRLGKPLTDWLATCSWNKGKFVVREKFIVDTGRNAKVKISGLGDNFSAWFLGTVEDESLHELKSFTLGAWTHDKDIIVKLGGVKSSIMSLGDLYVKMEKQPLGPKSPAGDLLTNGYANIGYVPQPVKKLEGNRFSYVGLDGKIIEEEVTDLQYLFEVKGQWCVLRAVHVYWHDDGWGVGARSVGVSSGWFDGRQVFSRNSSVLKSSEPVPAAS